jgi:hypothetical protein
VCEFEQLSGGHAACKLAVIQHELQELVPWLGEQEIYNTLATDHVGMMF